MKRLLSTAFIFLSGGIFSHITAQNVSLDDFHNGTLRPKAGPIYPFTPDGKDLLKSGKYVDNSTQIQENAKENGVQKGISTYWYVSLINPRKNFETGDTLFHSKWFKDSVPMGKFTLSDNREFMLIETDQESIYRHSFSVHAYVVNLKNKTVKAIPGRLRYPTLSPDNTKVAFVRENNLFVYDLSKNRESQITDDGVYNEIINGAVDWVYEEEFSMSQGFEWSPSGRYIAYYKFDESEVTEFSMDEFYDLYPNQVRWKYPKAGEDNSRVDVYVYDLRSKTKRNCPYRVKTTSTFHVSNGCIPIII